MLPCNSYIFVTTHKPFIWLIKGVLNTITLIKIKYGTKCIFMKLLEKIHIDAILLRVQQSINFQQMKFLSFSNLHSCETFESKSIYAVKHSTRWQYVYFEASTKVDVKCNLSIKTITHVELFLLTICHCILIDGTIHRLSLVSHFIV